MENNLKTNLKLLKARSNLVKAIQSIGLNSVSATKNKFLKNKETAPRFLYSSEPTKKKKTLGLSKGTPTQAAYFDITKILNL